MTDLAEDVFWEAHEGLENQAPGDAASTLRALSLLGALPPRPRILDVGCGPGRSSLALAGATDGTVVGLDTHAPFLAQLVERARETGLADRISTVRGSMFEMPFNDAAFDLLWCEGAVYLRGFDEALRDWGRFLVPGGGLALTDCTWLCTDPPEEARAFWADAYPSMRTVAANEQAARAAGYTVMGSFPLPEEAWEAYYAPLARRLPMLELRHEDNPEALAALRALRREMRIYIEHGATFGYVFYVLRRADG